MLRGVVRQPLSPKKSSAAAPFSVNSGGAAATPSDGATMKRNSSELQHHSQQRSKSHQQQHSNSTKQGKEKLIPLIRRSTFQRLDVFPFLIGYVLLISLDAYLLTCSNIPIIDTNDVHQTLHHQHKLAIAIDVLYLTLLASQLVLFLWSQWDPIVKARIAFRFYSSDFNDVNANSKDEQQTTQEHTIQRKLHDMKVWTHCLIIPPNPYDKTDSAATPTNKNNATTSNSTAGGMGSKRGKAATSNKNSSSASLNRPERPGIVPLNLETVKSSSSSSSSLSSHTNSLVATVHFRGWTYRCCCNYSVDESIDVHGDLPMESIWKVKSPSHNHRDKHTRNVDGLDEISDDEDERKQEAKSSTSAATSVMMTTKAKTLWEPQFHRLHFPIDLPLNFYVHHWNGHDSESHIENTNNTLMPTKQIYGTNTTIIPLPPFLSLLTQQLLQPLFLFQLFCVSLWSLDEYWIYAIFTLMSLIMFECTVAYNRWKGVKRLREEVVGGSDGENSNNIGKDHSNKKQQIVECCRGGKWISLPSHQLVVGDIISLVSPSIHNKSNTNSSHTRQRQQNIHDHERGCQIPADLLLLGGRAVVNEAMLTGESVPQVKESIASEVSADDGDSMTPSLDLSDGSAHKRCVLFGGTTLMDHHSEQGDGDNNGEPLSPPTIGTAASIPPPPNQGLVCFVLRTGFDTIQGQLLRTLAYHAESGGGGGGGNSGGGEGVNAKETFYFLLLLLLCALASAATVLDHAWGDVTRNHFKLILHVVIIITSVIPPELPMELSLAVTTSLGELIKRYQIYCTEPFRIPLAGLVDTCCFDKTGTLTSDELKLHGVRLPFPDINQEDNKLCEKEDHDLILMDNITPSNDSTSPGNTDTSHSSTASVSTTIRSLLPRETLRVMVGCQSLAVTHKFVPGRDGRTTLQTELCGDPLEKAVMEGCGWTLHPGKKVDTVVEKESLIPMSFPSSPNGGSIVVHHRFAFSSKLRRMTVLAHDSSVTSSSDTGASTLWALTKGAPEALKSMLDPNFLPKDYEETYQKQMALGRRVLALAFKNLGENTPSSLSKWKSSREKVEDNLIFAGLLIMDCPLKFDSARVVKELRAGHQEVVMVTGDAVLTAAEVARRVGIIDAPQDCTYELCHVKSSRGGNVKEFVFRVLGCNRDDGGKEGNNIIYSPSNIAKLALLVHEGKAAVCITGDVLSKIAIYAVEQASHSDETSSDIDDRTALNHPIARAELASLAPIVSVFARHAPRHKEAVIAAFNQGGRHTLMCGDGTNDVGALKQAHVGVSIISVPDVEAKQRSANETISAVKAEEKKARKAANKHPSKKNGGKSTKPKNSRAERIEQSLQALAEAENELAFVSLGNASVASPFTSRKTSIRCCKDILQQGRCTLVTMIQIYKILGVNCLVNALVLTKLHRKGIKQGDRQLTAVGLVVAGLFLFVTRGKPLPKLSTQKPPSSVLCKETLLSMAIQFAIHFTAIMAVTHMSDAYVDPYDPSMIPDAQFNPNTLNTATFLVTVLSTINTFVVNYRGRPFMENLNENVVLFRSIQVCYLVLFVCALDMFPPLNQLLQLSPLPSSGRPVFHSNFDNDAGEYNASDDIAADDENILQQWLLQAVDLVGFRMLLCVIMCLDTALVVGAEHALRLVMKS